MYVLITDFNAFRAMREKRNSSRYAEINTHKDYGYMSTSVRSYEEVKEMLQHTLQQPQKAVNEIIDKIVNGEEFTFEDRGITSTFRLATEDDIKNAEKDEIEYNKELDEFVNDPKNKTYIDKALSLLGLDDKK